MSVSSLVGSIPSALCNINVLTSLNLTDNPELLCTPACLSTVSELGNAPTAVCPTPQDTGICGVVSGFVLGATGTTWSCTTDSVPEFDPCDWPYVDCDGNDIVSIIKPNTTDPVAGIVYTYFPPDTSTNMSHYCMSSTWLYCNP